MNLAEMRHVPYRVPGTGRSHQIRRGRLRWVAMIGTVTLAGTVAVTGCTGSDSSPAAGSAVGRVDGGTGQAAAGEAAPAEAVAAAGSAAVPAAAANPAAVAAAARSRTVTARATVRVDRVPAAVDAVTRLATGAGGYVAGADVHVAAVGEQSPGDDPSATLSLRVPPARLAPVLTGIGRLGTVLESGRTETDVTGRVADLQARVTSQQASLQRLRSLFSRAGKLSEITALEQAITAREAELESLQAQRKALAAQVQDATLTVELVGPAAVVAADAPVGFGRGLHAGWSAAVATVRLASAAIGALVPFVPVAAVAAGLVVWRRRARRGAIG